MSHPPEQTAELKAYCTKLSEVIEGGVTYLFLENLRLPEGCSPPTCDGLLSPSPRDGYPSRLFLSTQVQCGFTRNWNFNGRIIEQNWVAFSWKLDGRPMTLKELLIAHLAGFTKAG